MDRIKLDLEREVYDNLRYMGMRFSEQTTDALNRFLFDGLPPGGHLEAMFAYDFERALYNADMANKQTFWALAMWIRECAPRECQGSYMAVGNWCLDKEARDAYYKECEQKYMWNQLKGNTYA
jgi:hypothetical protein